MGGNQRGWADLAGMPVLRHQFELQRGHMSIRRLLREAGAAVKAIKPVFMIEPTSVAQYLELGAVEFDLLIIDEASQVQPVDAFGAIARAKQFAVVGMTSSFHRRGSSLGCLTKTTRATRSPPRFKRVTSKASSAYVARVPQRMLRWHYRSRHHSLIAVSNHEFYEDRLYVIPSPGDPSRGRARLSLRRKRGLRPRRISHQPRGSEGRG